MVKEDDKAGLGKFERTEIEKSILEVYKNNSEPRLSLLKESLDQHEITELKKIGSILGSWCGDTPYGKFLDRKSNIELERPSVCMDLKGLEPYPDLQSACLLIITDLISREIEKNKTEMKFVVFDECWTLLEDEKGEGAALVGNLFRTCRKYFTSSIAISQNLDDFAKSKASSAIMTNSSIKWLLRQKGADENRLQEVLRLNDNELGLISSLHQEKGVYSEAFLICEDNRSVVVVESTPYEYWLATTDPKDIKEFDRVKYENPDFTQLQIIEQLAKEYPNGVSRKEAA
ncbi:MAG: ATP-binding protein [Bdellovibrionales bacterium]|nr:ATP-binding protein [Bdellovibrionales bacterium]